MNLSNDRIIIYGIIVFILSISLGFIIGFFSSRSVYKPTSEYENRVNYYNNLIEDYNKDGLEDLTKEVKPEFLREFLRNITSIPHQAGTENDKVSANYIYDSYKSFGLDSYELFDYDVLLDYPDDKKFNSIEIKLSSSEIEKLYEIEEPSFGDLDSKIFKPFLAYAKNGSVTSDEVYYVNYCMGNDFEDLIKKGINIKDKIVLCRYGQIYRGNKIKFAEIYGAKGALLFDDPKRTAPLIANNQIYPNGEFLPREGTQRGSLLTNDGDPLTPFYPSNEFSYRLNEKESYDMLPKIPAQVIGYGIAYDIFRLLKEKNEEVIDDWKGEMNMTYTYGGKLKDDRQLTLNVYNQRSVRKIYNVMGLIKGSVEPDRYVMIGNHRDSWTLGALDPSSGTAVLLELSRVLMKLKKENKWNPKRSVLFLSWAAEEYGLIGSVEWVEEYLTKLKANSIIYLNIDQIMGNYSFWASASPLLNDFIYKVTKSIKQESDKTAFDKWLENVPNKNKTAPEISPFLGSGSDHTAFAQRVGLPCIDQTFVRNKDNPYYKYSDLSIVDYATYHTTYETFKLVSEFLDPEFKSFRTLTVIAGEFIRRLSETLILPFNCSTYSEQLQSDFESFENDYKSDLNMLDINLDQLRFAIKNFSMVSNKFMNRLESIDTSKYHLIRLYNDQLRNVERAFLDESGRERQGYYHMIYAPSISNSYGGNFFPSLTDAIYNYKKNSTEILKEKIKYQLSILIYSVQSASSILREPHDFKRF